MESLGYHRGPGPTAERPVMVDAGRASAGEPGPSRLQPEGLAGLAPEVLAWSPQGGGNTGRFVKQPAALRSQFEAQHLGGSSQPPAPGIAGMSFQKDQEEEMRHLLGMAGKHQVASCKTCAFPHTRLNTLLSTLFFFFFVLTYNVELGLGTQRNDLKYVYIAKR